MVGGALCPDNALSRGIKPLAPPATLLQKISGVPGHLWLNPPPMADSRIHSLRNAFLTGLVLVAPLVVTVWALRLIIGFVGGSITPLFSPYLPDALSHLPAIFWDILTTII